MQPPSPLSHKIKVCCRAFRQLQKHGPQVKIRGAEERVCQNCGRTFVGNFCPACGQNATLEKFTWKNLFENVVLSFFSIDQGFWRTVLDLLYRPGYMIRDYLNGHRVPYFKPFQMLFVLAAVILLVVQLYYGDLSSARNEFIQSSLHALFNIFDPGSEIKTDNEIDRFLLTRMQHSMQAIQHMAWPETVKRLSSMLYDWLVGNLTAVVLLFMPFMYVAQRRTFRHTEVGKSLNGPETVIAMVYICDHWLILCLISTLLSYFFPMVLFAVGGLMFLCWILDLHQLYQMSYLKAAAYSMLIIFRLWLYIWIISLLLGLCFFAWTLMQG